MADDIIKESFLDSVESWLCNEYSAEIRYIAIPNEKENIIWSATIILNPLPFPTNAEFSFETSDISIGLFQKNNCSKKELIRIIKDAAEGIINFGLSHLKLPRERSYYFYSKTSNSETWFNQMHLQIGGDVLPQPSSINSTSIDNQLRQASPPFDGLLDAASWLGLEGLNSGSRSTSIQIHVNPPIDLIYDECRLEEDQITLTLHAHPKISFEDITLAVRAAPGNGITTRKQIAHSLLWTHENNGRKVGNATCKLENSDAVLVILMLGQNLVRRQWFLDPKKARNNRLLAVQYFDENLKMVRNNVLESGDQNKFELGIGSLLFLMGFSPAIQPETNAPDIIVTTPSGRLVLVECTIRIADFSTKVGKLVDRRGALSKSLEASGHPSEIAAVLVCRQPRDQIAAHTEELQSRKIILITGEDLENAFNRVRQQNDPDKMLGEAEAALEKNKDYWPPRSF